MNATQTERGKKMKSKAYELAAHFISVMDDDPGSFGWGSDFLADPEAWREGLSQNFVVNLSTGEQEVDEDDLIEAITTLLLLADPDNESGDG
jgi:hypothetical protein